MIRILSATANRDKLKSKNLHQTDVSHEDEEHVLRTLEQAGHTITGRLEVVRSAKKGGSAQSHRARR